MKKNNDLARSEVSEHEVGARNTASAASVPPDTEHMAAFARRLGVARSTITRAAQSGRLALTADGQVLVAASLARWLATRGSRDDVAARHAAQRGAPVAAHPSGATAAATGARQAVQEPAGGDFGVSVVPEDGQDVSGAQRAAAEAERLRWNNAMLQLSLELTRGTRIPRAALLREAQGEGNAFRASIERAVDQLAPRLAAAALDPAEQRRLMRAELLGQVAVQLRFGTARAMRRLLPSGIVSPIGSTAIDLTETEASA